MTPTLSQVNDVWQKILKDPEARRAVARLKKDGFRIGHLEPRDPTFKQPTWADYLAALPFLSNWPARRKIHRHSTLRKYVPLVAMLRHVARKADDPFCGFHIMSKSDLSVEENLNRGKYLRQTAEFLKKFLSWDWYMRDKNPRNYCIAVLRGIIRERTGSPHDMELATLIDAAFRAAEIKGGLYLDPATLDRIEMREKEGRVKATCRLLGVAVPHSITKGGRTSRSTRFRGKREKPV
jgi:hypothetical protein